MRGTEVALQVWSLPPGTDPPIELMLEAVRNGTCARPGAAEKRRAGTHRDCHPPGVVSGYRARSRRDHAISDQPPRAGAYSPGLPCPPRHLQPSWQLSTTQPLRPPADTIDSPWPGARSAGRDWRGD